MRHATLTLLSAAVVAGMAALGGPAGHATSEDERPGEIGIVAGVGFGDQNLVGSDNGTKVAPVIGGRFGWHFTPVVSGFLDYTWSSYKGDAANLFGDATEDAARIGPEF